MPKASSTKIRLDRLLVERGLADSCEKTRRMILAGLVLVDAQKIEKAGALVSPQANIRLLGKPRKFVSRGGYKLQGALEHFRVEAAGKTCLDLGASTGGFTDCLLQRGARKVYAVDVGLNQLAWKLRRDPRVISLEKTNARYSSPRLIGDKAQIAAMDVSFISATLILPALPPLLAAGADVLVLVKPQFEVPLKDVGKGGIVRDPRLHAEAVAKIAAKMAGLGFSEIEQAESVLPGATGNREFFLHAVWKKCV
jgi:23S rRNA (cytidine1920-2'-O)/16S rRNA (cytidine1409-2'-O)-methyltransferase